MSFEVLITPRPLQIARGINMLIKDEINAITNRHDDYLRIQLHFSATTEPLAR